MLFPGPLVATGAAQVMQQFFLNGPVTYKPSQPAR